MAGLIKLQPLRRRFHAVSIVADPSPCAQVKALTGVRLLSLEAPRLPVAGCTNPDGCSCRFQHHEDRRAGPRRSEAHASPQGTWSTHNRRRSLGRRNGDYIEN